MTTNELIYLCLFGGIAGYLGSLIFSGSGLGILGNIIVGIIGGIVGGFIFNALKISIVGGFVGSLIKAVVGAIVVLWVINMLKKTSR